MPVPILIVEDAPSDMILAKRTLRDMNLHVLGASSAEEALAIADTQELALVLLDYHLPDHDGPEVAQQLRKREKTRYTPIIFMTGDCENLELHHYESGAVDCINKPLEPLILRSKVNIFCELYQQRQLIQRHVTELESQKQQLEEAVREREVVEEALQESEIRYRTLLELSPVATLVQVNEKVVYVNTAVLELLKGSDREDFMDISILDYFEKDARVAGKEYLENLVRQGGRLPPLEAEWVRSNGDIISVQISGACIVYAGEIGVQLAVLDISSRKKMERELHLLSRRDALTRISNRRAFDENLERECRRCKREKSDLSLLLLDIDAFKPYNDHYGHPAGDEVLKIVAAALEKEMHRAADLVCRYGGEEFAAILPGTGFRGAKIVAERIRAAIETLALPHEYSPTSVVITASVGVVQTNHCLEPEQLIQGADRALYQAKNEGRNRVCAVQY